MLRQRVRARGERGDDPSEADVAVLERQLADHEALGDDELPAAIAIDTAQPVDLDAIAGRWLGASSRREGS